MVYLSAAAAASSASASSSTTLLPRLMAASAPSSSRILCSRALSNHASTSSPSGPRTCCRTYATVSSHSPPPSSSPAVQSSQAGQLAKDRKQLFEKLKTSYVMDHHVYKEEDLDTINILNYKPKTFSDRIAFWLVKMMRSTFDFATRYPGTKKFPLVAGREKDLVKRDEASYFSKGGNAPDDLPQVMPLEEIRSRGLSFSPEQWLQRCIFLESVAGCPGSVAAVARHLHSLRLLRRDKGWIHMCLEDAENERMHLLSFMAIAKPTRLMRLMLLGAQGVFFNALFALYLVHPRTVHRFVGLLEEEAVKTYTGLIKDVEEGRLPEWEQMPAPDIAKEYWKLPQDATMLHMIRVVRADEAGHRFIHHTLADLDQKNDTNPFSVATPTPHMIGTKLHLTREESLQFIEEAKKMAQQEIKAASEHQQQQQQHKSSVDGARFPSQSSGGPHSATA